MAQVEIIDLVRKYILLLNASGIPVVKAFLYGSYSRNEAQLDSDIDVMVISPVFDIHNDKIKAKAWLLSEKVDVRIEPYTVGVKKFFSDDISPLLQILKKEGLEINT
ncbi:MAG: nucleotidyltransferase domain-containing protein [Bacteroidales bacterium]|nr:nucleotidyltransferase domain-containing protein [Bacteroidales bacterium]